MDNSRNYADFLISDELQQFKGNDCQNTLVLLEALAKELQEVYRAFEEIKVKTTLDASVGVQLDNIGDIVKLTRAQAGMLSSRVTTDINSIESAVLEQVTTPTELLERHASKGIIPMIVLDDETYREYLYYKIFLNTNTCTYPDLMKSLRMFWKASPVYYSEDVPIRDVNDIGYIENDPNNMYHATIKLSTPELDPSKDARLYFIAPIIKAAGVTLFRQATTVTPIDGCKVHIGGHVWNPTGDTTLPPMIYEMISRKDVHRIPFGENYTISELPEINEMEE